MNSSAVLGGRDLSSLLDWSWAPLDLEVPLSRAHLSGLMTVNLLMSFYVMNPGSPLPLG